MTFLITLNSDVWRSLGHSFRHILQLNLLVSLNYLVFRLSLDQNRHCDSLVRQYEPPVLLPLHLRVVWFHQSPGILEASSRRVPSWYCSHRASRADLFSAWIAKRIASSLIARKVLAAGRTASVKEVTNSSRLVLLRRIIQVVTITVAPATLRKVQ